jgi:hypothetical protein
MRRAMKIVAGLAAGGAIFWLATSAALYVAMRQPPDRFGALMAHVPPVMLGVLPFKPLWMSARAGALAIGDIAPDFQLPTLHGGGVIRLSDRTREKPVVLIFGSYT